MQKRYCGMCGGKTKSIAQLRLMHEGKISEVRWCIKCGALGIRELYINSNVELYEIWQEPSDKSD